MNRPVKLYVALLTMTAGTVLTLAGLQANDATAKKDGSPMKLTYAVTPKPLTDAVKKGLDFLVKQQQDNGGWGQGGGWRNQGPGGGRIEGKNVEDPPDVGNTCVAVLALIRAGSTPTDGPYAKNVAKAIDFIMNNVEKSDAKSMVVSPVKGTQLHGKIGPFVDIFLTTLVLAELKGKMGDENGEKRLFACLTKAVGKIELNQRQDGTFAGNEGWASVLSQGIGNWGLSRAKMAGAPVKEETIARVQKQVVGNFDGRSGSFKAPGAAGSDAGVAIYGQSAQLRNVQDVVGANSEAEKKARDVLLQKDAPKEEKQKAEQVVKNAEEARKTADEAVKGIVRRIDDKNFVAGFGSNGGEEFLSFLNISETLVVKGGAEWEKWDKAMNDSLSRVQDKDGSWAGHHCITGRTFCTASALLVLMADRTQVPVVDKKDSK